MDSLHSAFSTEIVRQGYAARTKSSTHIIWSLVVYDVVPQLLYLRLVDDNVLTICFSG